MIETREKKIKSRVFTKKDIENLWKVFNSQFSSSKIKNNHTSLNMQVRCEDGTRYESEGNELLSDGNIFDLKKVISINFEYYDYKEEKRIALDLTHGNRYSYDSLTVKGDDNNWVAGIFNNFEILLNSIKPQQHWFLKYKVVFLFSGVIIFSTAFMNSVLYLKPSYLGVFIKNEDFIVNYMFYLLIFSIYGLVIFVFLTEWVARLWPNIEFDFGPEHYKIEKNKRNRIGSFLTIIVIQLIFLFIPYFIK